MAVRIEAATRQLVMESKGQAVKRVGIKGLHGMAMSLEQYREVIVVEGKSEQRGWQPKKAS